MKNKETPTEFRLYGYGFGAETAQKWVSDHFRDFGHQTFGQLATATAVRNWDLVSADG